jgi:hypothetical protein
LLRFARGLPKVRASQKQSLGAIIERLTLHCTFITFGHDTFFLISKRAIGTGTARLANESFLHGELFALLRSMHLNYVIVIYENSYNISEMNTGNII